MNFKNFQLEQQNERLRAQNLKCIAQLQVLKSCADRTKRWQNSIALSQSVIEALPSKMVDRISDDSGLTSDDTWEKKADLMTKSASELHKSASLRYPKKPSRLKSSSQSRNDDCDETSSTTDSSPWDEKLKPVPMPRATKSKSISEKEKSTIQRISLNSYDDENYYKDDEDEVFDEIDFAQSPNEKNMVDYVNLNEMFLIGTNDYLSNATSPPALPVHRPPNQWEIKLYQTADHCLSTVLTDEQLAYCNSMLQKLSFADNTSDLCSSPSRRSEQSSCCSQRRHSHEITVVAKECDYYVPPDAGTYIRAALIASDETIEKCGYLIQLSDSRLKSLKRRYFVLKDGYLTLFKSQKNFLKNEEAIAKIAIADILSLSKITNKIGVGLQIITSGNRYCYSGESDKVTDDWFNALNNNLRANTISEVIQRCTALDASISGYVVRAKCGNSKRFFAAVVGSKLIFFKNPDDKIPCSHILLKGAHICEKPNGSTDEYSGSSDEQCENKTSSDFEHTISIEVSGADPVYIVLRSAEEKDKWIYFLKKSADEAVGRSSPFEAFIQKLMAENSIHESPLWQELKKCDERCKEPLITTGSNTLIKKAVELGRACYMFTFVLMRPAGVQYHIDLAQNILSTAVSNDSLKNELYAHLIKLTSGSMAYGIQAWKLLALTCPLFTPRQYSLLWLLRRHIERWMAEISDEGRFAVYCERALNRCLKEGDRLEGPSKLEVISILTRDPTSTKMPHSMPVLLPTGNFYVIDFDGSTDIGDCLSVLCVQCGLRPALLSGYALYIEDVMEEGSYVLLKGKQKLCDCLSRWERELISNKSGRVTDESARIRLVLRMRQYWSHLESFETSNERIFLVYRMASEIVQGKVPVSSELAEELAALYAQMIYGDISDCMTDEQFKNIITCYYPTKLLDICSERTLRLNIASHWTQLQGTSVHDCVRIILVVLRKWRFFGSYVCEARMKMHNGESIFIALNDQGVHLLTYKQLDLIRSFPYHRLVSFGEFRNDFMVTVERVLPPAAHPEETTRERLTFSMPSKSIHQLTCHLSEYIRCQKLVWKLSTKKLRFAVQ